MVLYDTVTRFPGNFRVLHDNCKAKVHRRLILSCTVGVQKQKGTVDINFHGTTVITVPVVLKR